MTNFIPRSLHVKIQICGFLSNNDSNNNRFNYLFLFKQLKYGDY